MDKHIIVGVHLVDRETHAVKTQQVFTKYGARIKTRLGLHDDICPSNGQILLEMEDTPETSRMIEELEAMEGVDCKTMTFAH